MCIKLRDGDFCAEGDWRGPSGTALARGSGGNRVRQEETLNCVLLW